MSARVLYVGKSAASQESCAHLEKQGFEITCTKGFRPSMRKLSEFDPHILIVDMNDIGEIVTRRITRAAMRRESAPFVLLISNHRTFPEEVKYDRGLVRPFTSRRLIETVRDLLESRRGYVIQAGPLALDRRTRYVRTAQNVIKLPPKQFQLLDYLMQHPGEVLSRRELMEAVWNTAYVGDTRTLDVHIRWLRQRIEEEPSRPQLICTVRGHGYCLNVDGPPQYGGEPIVGG
ncbi:MAG: response regulator transcription factor [Chloroflexi bacterium]|nr:response regulator transcription factor [Chloroflexota bacterium]